MPKTISLEEVDWIMKRRLVAALLGASALVLTGIACASRPAVPQAPLAALLTPVETATALPRQPIVPPPPLTFTPTPTRTVVAVEATATIVAVELWHGTLQSTGNLPVPGNPCHDAFDTVLDLTVSPGGQVTGTGQSTAAVLTTCVKQPSQPPVTAVTLRIEGRRFSDRFEIRLFPVAVSGLLEGGFFANWMGPSGVEPPLQVIPIVAPGRAEGQVRITDTSKFKAGTTDNTYSLRCTSCS
jgi:hypothetical protein